MTCRYYNRAQGCACCGQFLRSTEIKVSNNSVIIKVPHKIIRNQEKICVYLAQNIPNEVSHKMDVKLHIDEIDEDFLLLTNQGNSVYADQLISQKVLHMAAITDLMFFRLLENRSLTRTDHSFPAVTELLL